MRICLRPNGADSGEVIEFAGTFEDLVTEAGRIFHLDSPVFFTVGGDLVNSLSVLRDNDVLYVAKKGDMFFDNRAASRAREFEAFSMRKKRERESFFKQSTSSGPKKKAKVSISGPGSTCKVTVGFVEWKSYKKKGSKKNEPKLMARKQVGQKMMISISVATDAPASRILEKAIEAFKRIDSGLESIQRFHLLYPDLKTEVDLLPKSEDSFTPKKYVALLGTYYSKIRLYIVTAADWMACQLYQTRYQPLESSSSSHSGDEQKQNECTKSDASDDGDDDEVHFKGQTPDKYKTILVDEIQCEICKSEIKPEDFPAHPVGCECPYHEFYLTEWLKTANNGTIKCPVCLIDFSEVELFMVEIDSPDICNEVVIPSSSSTTTDNPILSYEDVDLPFQTTQPGRRSPGYQFRQNYLPQFMTALEAQETEERSDTDTQQVQVTNHSSRQQVDLAAGDQEIGEACNVHRARLKEDLINIFKREPSTRLSSMRVIDEHGRIEEGEGNGVTRDILATFWQQIFASACVGDKDKVPCIRHDFQKREWEAIGRILVYGFKRAGYFPIALSKAFLASCIFGEESINNDYLLSSFRSHITSDEREIFDMIQRGDCEEPDGDDVLEFLGNYKTYTRPTKESIAHIVLELAHQELIQRPRYIAQCWSPVLNELKEHEQFSSPKRIEDFFAAKMPTTRKVVQSIECRPGSDAERQCLDFLKKFIRSLDSSPLGTFLKYTTGSDIMLEKIEVSFTSMDGFARRPIAHTCGPLLELPRTYQSYNELVEEFTSLLRDKGAWGFNIV